MVFLREGLCHTWWHKEKCLYLQPPATRDVPIKSWREDRALHTIKWSDAASIKKRGVWVTHGAKIKRCSHNGCINSYRREEFVGRMAAKGSLKRCSFLGCTSYAKKGGVCYRHCSKSINIYNNPLQGVITELPPILSYQSINYEDEEELYPWQIPTK